MSTSRFVVEHIRLTTTKPFDQVRADFERQLGRFDAHAYRSLASGENTDTVRARIEAMAGPSGLMAFATHDHGALLRLVGLTRQAVQYVVGNPLYAVQMTQHAIGASLYAPLRVLLSESDAGEICAEYDRPASLFGQFGDDRIAQVEASLDHKLENLVATAMR
ncbi:MAG TPA: DUF302 domain-containing protein [Candidatus Binatia bacterium]|nr:DUF302 domain-containing protein [Candidatus Binatia bacterium]